MSILNDRGQAEQALQEATTRAWRNLRRLRDEASGRAWFFALVADRCRSVRPHAAAEPEAAPATDLQRALRALTADERLALYLRYYLELPLPEVAIVLGVSEKAARSRIHRAAQGLRGAIEVPEVLT
ncbi:MAG TPA: sigma-70 family RNA polymerase sigma factor [Candidatus Limnocylindrales bacterium]|nr:sigma-70 family RNA polymerase sigma factor [Candidatus Limnocylindrales bacterium]